MELFDIGVNLANRAFRNDLLPVLERARAAGVRMVVTGTSVPSSRAALELAKAHGLWSTAGVHPHDAKSCDGETLGALRALASEEPVVAIGECGLDYDRDFSPRPVQDRWFEAQVELAAELEMPLFLHERDAHHRFVEILRRHRERIPAACIHCFTGTDAELSAYLDLDLHVGITGWICDERRGLHLRSLVSKIPEDRLMIETDAPYLLPRTIRPKPKDGRNEPSFLVHVLDAIAEATGRTREAVAESTTRTARAFFRVA
jgi:TatD DNase family protein